MREARILLRLARELVSDRLRDEIGMDGRTLFRGTQEAIEGWMDENDWLDAEIDIDYTTTFSGQYYPQTMTSPAEYPEMDLEIDRVDITARKNRPLPLKELLERIVEATRSDVDPAVLGESRAAMRTIKAAIDKWSADLVDVPVSRDGSFMYDLPENILIVKAKLTGNRVVFTHSDIKPNDLSQKTWEVADDDLDRWGDIPER
jgi:hypothetical protein